MDCLRCGRHSYVVDSRGTSDQRVRLYECQYCGARMVTLEAIIDYIDGVDLLNEYRNDQKKRRENNGLGQLNSEGAAKKGN